MKLKIIRVEWVDARASVGWIDKDEITTNPPVVTYGIHGGKTKDSLIIYAGYDPVEKQYADRNLIPLRMVKRIKTISTEEF